MKLDNLSGQKFGRLTVLSRATNKGTRTRWKCICECGNETIAHASALKDGHTTSCGCYANERRGDSHRTHGKTHTRLHDIWSNIVQRTENPENPSYKHYGARGISMCPEWRNNAAAFMAWAEANGYNETLTIDRIDVMGNYCPENCRWVTKTQQANNKTNSRYVEAFGRRQTIAEWGKERGVNAETLRNRIDRGWPIELALNPAKVPHGYTWKELVSL